jgi:uncharacterized membrane protein
MTGREHARLLGLFFWLLTGFQLAMVAALGIFYVFLFGTVFSNLPQRPGEPGPEFFLTILVVVMAFVFLTTLAFSIPKVVAAYGLRNEKPWARVWAIVACCMSVMSVPLGTAVGVYGLIFLFGDEGKRYFEQPDLGKSLPEGYPKPAYVAPPVNSWKQP